MMEFFFIPIILFITHLQKVEVLIIIFTIFLIIFLLTLPFLIKKKNKNQITNILIILITTGLLILSLKSSLLNFSFETEAITKLSGVVVEDSQIAKFKQRRVTINLNECNLKNGDASSANGIITVYSQTKRLYTGDKIEVIGSFQDGEFNAKTILLKERRNTTKFRIQILEIIENRIKENTPRNISNLKNLLLLGFSEMDDFELKTLAKESGSSFVLALSGMHLTIYYSLLSIILFPFKKESKGPIILIFLTLFVFLIGNKASLIRALILRTLFMLFKKRKTSEILSLTLIIHLLISPLSAISLSSLYSYSALSGILFISPTLDKLKERFHPIISFSFSSILITTSALAFSSHISLFTFSSFQLSILLTSVILTFLITIFLTLSVISLFVNLPIKIMIFFYEAIKRVMIFGSSIKATSNASFIFILIYLLLVIYLFCMIEKDVEPKLRQ